MAAGISRQHKVAWSCMRVGMWEVTGEGNCGGGVSSCLDCHSKLNGVAMATAVVASTWTIATQ